MKAILCAIDKRVTVTAEKIPENKILIKSNIGELEVPLNKSMIEINSPLKPFFYLASKILSRHTHRGRRC
jgi:mevalonate kinase